MVSIEDIKFHAKELSIIEKTIEPDVLSETINNLFKQMQEQDFWNDTENATKVSKEHSTLKKKLETFNAIKQNFDENVEIYNFAELEQETELMEESSNNLKTLFKEINNLKIQSLLSDPIDINNTYIEINSGAGGTESCDWAEMLMRMYMRWAEKKNFSISTIDIRDGEEAGIKSCIMIIKGDYAYGNLKHETGVHRLVRISPFDSNSRRHTSFASVLVYPEINDNITVEIASSDIRVDTFRASGAGGQHVNTTDSAVRITHLETNIVSQCQSHRSQHKNKEEALKTLKAKIYQKLIDEQNEGLAKNQEKDSNGWGSQIRSYVLHPYQSIKDNRTNFESTNSNAILNGDIDGFIESCLIKL